MSNEAQNRFDRIVAILIQLQTRRVVKARDLADRFQVSLRTIYRDIRSLEAAGVPITGEAGIGYSVMDGYRLPPVMFTREEAASFVAGEKLMQRFTDKRLGAHYESAMYKIKSVLRGSVREHVAALESQIWISSAHELFHENTPDALEILLESIAGRKQVSLHYKAFEREEAVSRTIEPVGLFHEHNYWYVMGYCHLRQDYRQFRTDRILRIGRTDHPFTREEHMSIEAFRNARPDMSDRIRVVFRVHREAVKYIRTGRKYYGFVSETEQGDYMEMTFMVNEHSDTLARWYMMFGDCSEIVSPDSFRQQVRQMAEKVLRGI